MTGVFFIIAYLLLATVVRRKADHSTHVFIVAPDPDRTDFLFCRFLEKEILIPFHLRWKSIPEMNYDC
jgi:hypothetical protein